jgi:hypothetical protein
MKRAVAIVVVLTATFLGYRYYSSSYAAVRQYKQFAEAVLHRQFDDAAAMTDDLTVQQISRAGTQENIGAGPGMFQTLFPSRFNIESQEKAADGTLTLHAVQTVLFNPPGVESAVRPAMYATMNQAVTMRKVGGGWRITSFENKFDKMASLTSR